MPLLPFLRKFLENPFETLDNLDLRYYGFQFNILKDDVKLQRALFQIFFLIPMLCWLLLGADSTADQVMNLLLNIPNWLLGHITLNQLIAIYNSWYGLGTHWSASVIYTLLFIGISKHLRDKLEVENSLNLAITTGFVGLTIAAFEFTWMASYYVFQGQHWIFSLQFPQLRIILQDMLFAFTGLLVLAGFNWKRYKLNVDKLTALAFTATIGLLLLWWFYPFPTQQITVGAWTSRPMFPQTMWTIQPNPNVAYGELYYTANEGVHLVNNLAKIAMTLAFYSLFKIKER
jgi:hypothetical protein